MTSLNFEDVDASYVALLGTKQKEKKFSPSLWISTNEKKKFQKIWESPESLDSPLQHSQIYVDTQQTLHIMYLCADNIIYHHWIKLAELYNKFPDTIL